MATTKIDTLLNPEQISANNLDADSVIEYSLQSVNKTNVFDIRELIYDADGILIGDLGTGKYIVLTGEENNIVITDDKQLIEYQYIN